MLISSLFFYQTRFWVSFEDSIGKWFLVFTFLSLFAVEVLECVFVWNLEIFLIIKKHKNLNWLKFWPPPLPYYRPSKIVTVIQSVAFHLATDDLLPHWQIRLLIAPYSRYQPTQMATCSSNQKIRPIPPNILKYPSNIVSKIVYKLNLITSHVTSCISAQIMTMLRNWLHQDMTRRKIDIKIIEVIISTHFVCHIIKFCFHFL